MFEAPWPRRVRVSWGVSLALLSGAWLAWAARCAQQSRLAPTTVNKKHRGPSLLQVAQEGRAGKERDAANAQQACASRLRRQERRVGVRHEVHDRGGSGEEQHRSGGQLARRRAISRDGESTELLRLGQQAQALDVGQREARLLSCKAERRNEERDTARGARVRSVPARNTRCRTPTAGEPLARGAACGAAVVRVRQRQRAGRR